MRDPMHWHIPLRPASPWTSFACLIWQMITIVITDEGSDMSSVGDQKARVVSTLPPCSIRDAEGRDAEGRDAEGRDAKRHDGATRISAPALRSGTA